MKVAAVYNVNRLNIRNKNSLYGFYGFEFNDSLSLEKKQLAQNFYKTFEERTPSKGKNSASC